MLRRTGTEGHLLEITNGSFLRMKVFGFHTFAWSSKRKIVQGLSRNDVIYGLLNMAELYGSALRERPQTGLFELTTLGFS